MYDIQVKSLTLECSFWAGTRAMGFTNKYSRHLSILVRGRGGEGKVGGSKVGVVKMGCGDGILTV